MYQHILRTLVILTILSFPIHGISSDFTITPVPSNLHHSHLTHALSGDGKHVFFASLGNPVGRNEDGNMEVFLYEVDSGNTYQITETQTLYNGWWNHNTICTNFDGTRIAFRSTFALDTNKVYINQYDVFIANITYTSGEPSVTFQRITTTDERLTMTLSGNGSILYLASRHNLANENPYGNIEIFRINLDPNPHIEQITHTTNGIVQGPGNQLRIEMDTNYRGNTLVFNGNSDIVTGSNTDGNFEIFKTMAGSVRQLTTTAPPVWNKDPVIGGSPHANIMFSSNGNFTGSNADGNREIFLNEYSTIYQVTDTSGGDAAFGGANGHIRLSGTPEQFIFSSTRNHSQGSGSLFDNADENREIFLGKWELQGNTLNVDFEQITNTTNISPGSYFENINPQVSAIADVIAFSSDLDLGFSGDNKLYIAKRPVSPGATLDISSFVPGGGGPGVTVNLKGDGFSAVNSVKFGNLEAIRFNILSDTRIEAVVPTGVSTAPITVQTADGQMATSNKDFKLLALKTYGMEFNQGFPDYPAVSGKNTLVRVFTSVDTMGQAVPGAVWHISDATLTITSPSNQIHNDLRPSIYWQDVGGSGQTFSENANVNFYIPGPLLSEEGTYSFQVTIQTEGQIVFDGTIEQELVKTKDVVLYFRSVLRHPNESEWKSILRGFETFSRVYPVRSGIGDLRGAIGASDDDAGLRVAYVSTPIWENDPRIVGDDMGLLSFQGCYAEIIDILESGLAAINSSSSFEHTEFGVAFIPQDKIPGPDGVAGCPFIDCDTQQQIGNYIDDKGKVYHIAGLASADTAWVLLCNYSWSVFCHEAGHLFGIDHITADDQKFIEGPAFNLRTRRSISFPRNVMHYLDPQERLFVHNGSNNGPSDYPDIVSRRRLNRSGKKDQRDVLYAYTTYAQTTDHNMNPVKENFIKDTKNIHDPVIHSTTASIWKTKKRFVLMASLNPTKGLFVHNSYVVNDHGSITPVDPKSDYALVFRDNSKQILQTDLIPFKPARIPKGGNDVGIPDPNRGSLAVIRPLPKGTAEVEIQRKGKTLYRIAPESKAPIITKPSIAKLKQKDKTLVQLNWNANDPDGDKLSYGIEFSRDDGRTYVPLIPSTQNTKLSFNQVSLPGGHQLRFRITASDGLNITSMVTPRFSLPDHTPYVAITSLSDGDEYAMSASIPLHGLAYDMEDGLLNDGKNDNDRYQWFLDDNILIGKGVTTELTLDNIIPLDDSILTDDSIFMDDSIPMDNSVLMDDSILIHKGAKKKLKLNDIPDKVVDLKREIKPGRHKITLKVTDGSGSTSTDTVSIFLNPDLRHDWVVIDNSINNSSIDDY